MNDDSGGSRNRRRRWLRLAAVLAVTAVVTPLMAACGGGSSDDSSGSSGSSHPSGSTAYQQELAYAQCMRSHGVPKFPDPASNGLFVNNGAYDPSSSQYHSADNICRHLLPNGGQLSQPQLHQQISQLLQFARCMRSHGVPKFPDPASNGTVNFKGTGIDIHSPQFQSAQQACQSLMPTHLGTSGGGS